MLLLISQLTQQERMRCWVRTLMPRMVKQKRKRRTMRRKMMRVWKMLLMPTMEPKVVAAPCPHSLLRTPSFLTCTEDRESGVSCLMMGQSCYDRFLFDKLAVTGRHVHKCAFCETEHFVYYSPLHRTSLLSPFFPPSPSFPFFLSLPLSVH